MSFLIFLYYFKKITLNIILVSLVILILLSLLNFIQLLDELNQNYTIQNLIFYLFLQTPLYISEQLGYIMFLGLTFSLIKISSDNELVIFLAAGVRENAIKIIMIISALICYIIFIIFFEIIGSRMLIYSYEYEEITKNNQDKTYSGWLKSGQDLIHIGYAKQKLFENVSRFEFRNNKLISFSSASHANPSKEESKWLIKNEKKFLFNNPNLNKKKSRLTKWEVQVDYNQLLYLFISPADINLKGLIMMSKSLYNYNAKIISKYFIELLRRLMDWLKASALFLLIAPMLFKPSRQIQKSKIIFLSIIIGLILFTFMENINRYILLNFQVNVFATKIALLFFLLILPRINKIFFYRK